MPQSPVTPGVPSHRAAALVAAIACLLAGLLLTGVAQAQNGPTAVVAKRGKDNDGDGLSNKLERSRYKTNWRRKDTDGDRLGDGAEVLRYRTDPLRKDTDRDRVKDGTEVLKYRTSPRRSDTDRDGLSDWREIVRYKTNPRGKDTDGDGLTDGAEVRTYKTNPRRKDTDRDGIPDGAEVLRGQNPKVKNGAGGPAPGPAPGPVPPSSGGSDVPVRACSTVVSSLAAVQSAVAAAAPGTVVCLADGSYGALNLSASKSGEVTVQAQNPGRAVLGGATLSGSYLTLARFNISSDVTLLKGSEHLSVIHNRLAGGYFGIDAGPTTTTPISDTTILGNQFVGPFGEDGIRLNRYHDGPDADPYGVLIEGNEFTNIRENGNHSDCLQTVYYGDGLYFRRNYLHDNKCQGFFIKDQYSPVVNVVADDNLFIRDNAPCAPPLEPGCGDDFYLQLLGPITNLVLRRNTIWSDENDGGSALRGTGWNQVTVENNVILRPWADSSAPFASGYQASGNVGCAGGSATLGSWPSTGFVRNCSPPFPNRAAGDYRIGSAGVTWQVSDQHFGP